MIILFDSKLDPQLYWILILTQTHTHTHTHTHISYSGFFYLES